MKVALISSSSGGFDTETKHEKQSVEYEHHMFNDDNFPPRHCAMTPRMQAKIPKCFGWQMAPDYDRYLYLDGNITMINKDTLKFFIDATNDYDIAVLRHPKRDTVYWEYRYLRRGIKVNSIYMMNRYTGEHYDDQIKAIKGDKSYVDDYLVLGGVFMYKNTPEVQKTLKEWWYHISRYLIQDQLAWAYVLKKSGLKVNVLDIKHNEGEYLAHRGHIKKH